MDVKVSPKMPNGEFVVRHDVVPIGAIFEVGNAAKFGELIGGKIPSSSGYWIRRNGCGYGPYATIDDARDALVRITNSTVHP